MKKRVVLLWEEGGYLDANNFTRPIICLSGRLIFTIFFNFFYFHYLTEKPNPIFVAGNLTIWRAIGI